MIDSQLPTKEYLGRNTSAYYAALAEVGGGHWQPHRDTRQWTRFILTAHLRQARTLLARIKEAEQLWIELERLVAANGLAERTMVPLFDAVVGLRVRNATYRAALAESGDDEVSEQMATRDFARLVDAGLLLPHGAKRGRYYVASQRLTAIRQSIRDERVARDDSDPFAA